MIIGGLERDSVVLQKNDLRLQLASNLSKKPKTRTVALFCDLQVVDSYILRGVPYLMESSLSKPNNKVPDFLITSVFVLVVSTIMNHLSSFPHEAFLWLRSRIADNQHIINVELMRYLQKLLQKRFHKGIPRCAHPLLAQSQRHSREGPVKKRARKTGCEMRVTTCKRGEKRVGFFSPRVSTEDYVDRGVFIGRFAHGTS